MSLLALETPYPPIIELYCDADLSPPLWDVRGNGVAVNTLGLSSGLLRNLHRWVQYYHVHTNLEGYFDSPDTEFEHAARGIKLHRQLEQELEVRARIISRFALSRWVVGAISTNAALTLREPWIKPCDDVPSLRLLELSNGELSDVVVALETAARACLEESLAWHAPPTSALQVSLARFIEWLRARTN